MDARVAYEDVWNTFINGDHVSVGTIWGGEGLALIVPVEQPAIVDRIRRLQAALAAQVPFEPLPPDALHITIYLFGNPSPGKIPELTALLGDKIKAFPQFEINLAGVNSFFRAPFVEVHAGGILAAVTSSLLPGLRERGYSHFDYGPSGQIFHMTLGAYTEAGDGAAARQVLNRLRPAAVGNVFVEELWLVKTSAGKPYRMTTLNKFPLQERSDADLPAGIA